VTTIGICGSDLVFDSSGNLYWAVTNSYNGTTYAQTSYVYKITPDGVKTTFTSVATTGATNTGLAIDAANNVYWSVGNSGNGTTIILTSYVYKITPGGVRTTFASTMTNHAGGSAGLIFDRAGNLYWSLNNIDLVTTTSSLCCVYKITPAGVKTVFGLFSALAPSNQMSLAFDSIENLYWSTINNGGLGSPYAHLIKITPAGVLTTMATALSINVGAGGSCAIVDGDDNIYWVVNNYYDGTTYNQTSYMYRIDKQTI
jgi:hypothetical protein